MRYEEIEPAIPVHTVNIYAVYYSHNITADCHNLSATTSQPAANKYTGVPPAFTLWFRLFNR